MLVTMQNLERLPLAEMKEFVEARRKVGSYHKADDAIQRVLELLAA